MLTALVSCVVVEPSNAVDVILNVNGVTLFGGKLGSVKLPPVPAKRDHRAAIHNVKTCHVPKMVAKLSTIVSSC